MEAESKEEGGSRVAPELLTLLLLKFTRSVDARLVAVAFEAS